jgi:hypothetical protein
MFDSSKWRLIQTFPENMLYTFQGGSDGPTPAGMVVFDAAGKLIETSLLSINPFRVLCGKGGWRDSQPGNPAAAPSSRPHVLQPVP